METKQIKHISIFGIDGSGKSSVVKKLMLESQNKKSNFSVMTCPSYHETPNIKMKELSEALERMNQLGDEYSSFELKSVALYLQLTIYSYVKQNIMNNDKPEIIISERHPIIDFLVYGSYYVKYVKRNLENISLKAKLIKELKNNNYWNIILQWFKKENERLNRRISIWEMPLYLRGLYDLDKPELIKTLSEHFKTDFPDIAVLIDINHNLANKHLAKRNKKRELHEHTKSLEDLKNGYNTVFNFLKDFCLPKKIIFCGIKVCENMSLDNLNYSIKATINRLTNDGLKY